MRVQNVASFIVPAREGKYATSSLNDSCCATTSSNGLRRYSFSLLNAGVPRPKHEIWQYKVCNRATLFSAHHPSSFKCLVCSYATSSSDAGMSNRVDGVDIYDLLTHLAHLSIGVECTAVCWKVKRIEYIHTLTLLKYHSIPPMHQGLTLAQRVN